MNIKTSDYTANDFSANHDLGSIRWYDKNSTDLAYLKMYSKTDGKIWHEIAGTYGTGVWKQGLVVGYDTVANEMFTRAPTPSSIADRSDKIATTEWVSNYAMKIQPVVSKFVDAPNGAVTLQYNTKIYRVTGTVSAFTFNTSNLGTLANDEALEFKLFIPSTTNASAQNIWPASVRFLNEEAPTLATGRNYVATLFSIDKGTTWWLAMSGWNYALWG